MHSRTTGAMALFIALIATNIAVMPVLATYQGCTPGFWKQEHHFDHWVDYSPTDTIGSVFNIPGEIDGTDTRKGPSSSDTLLEALQYRGGSGLEGGARILLRQAVAGLLNVKALGYAGTHGTGYHESLDGLIDGVNAALASLDREWMLNTAALLDEYNNAGGCPFC